MECWDDIVLHVEVRGDASVGDGGVCLAVVVVEMQGEETSQR